jgi:hypothetical protein
MKCVEKGRKIVVVGSHYSVNVPAILCIEVSGYKIKVLGSVNHRVKNFLCDSM